MIAADCGLDAIILDVGLPRMSGLDVARQLRLERSRIPILMLTARDAIEQGWPASTPAPTTTSSSRSRTPSCWPGFGRSFAAGPTTSRRGRVISRGPIQLDEGPRRVTVNGRRVDLTLREFALLECLMRHPDQVLSRDQLLDHAWPFGSAVTLNSVDAYVAFLRRKLGPDGGPDDRDRPRHRLPPVRRRRGGLTMDAREIEHRSPDQPLLRKTRLRFLAWSAGVTLVALSWSAARSMPPSPASLADAATDQLRSRAAEMGAKVSHRDEPSSNPGSRPVSCPTRPNPAWCSAGPRQGRSGSSSMSMPDGSIVGHGATFPARVQRGRTEPHRVRVRQGARLRQIALTPGGSGRRSRPPGMGRTVDQRAGRRRHTGAGPQPVLRAAPGEATWSR